MSANESTCQVWAMPVNLRLKLTESRPQVTSIARTLPTSPNIHQHVQSLDDLQRGSDEAGSAASASLAALIPRPCSTSVKSIRPKCRATLLWIEGGLGLPAALSRPRARSLRNGSLHALKFVWQCGCALRLQFGYAAGVDRRMHRQRCRPPLLRTHLLARREKDGHHAVPECCAIGAAVEIMTINACEPVLRSGKGSVCTGVGQYFMWGGMFFVCAYAGDPMYMNVCVAFELSFSFRTRLNMESSPRVSRCLSGLADSCFFGLANLLLPMIVSRKPCAYLDFLPLSVFLGLLCPSRSLLLFLSHASLRPPLSLCLSALPPTSSICPLSLRRTT